MLIPVPVQGATGSCQGGLLEKVQRTYQATKSFAGQFEQIDQRSDGSFQRARGELAYRRPGNMRWRYDPPHEQLLVTDGKTVWLFDPLLDNVTVQPLGNLTQGTPLSFLLGVGNLTDDFICRPLSKAPPEDGLIYLELLPRKPIPGLAYIQLGVHSGEVGIGVLRMVDRQGNLRQVRLSRLKTGVGFPKEYFTFRIEEGMEVISK
ncbi:MAG: outer membrane lipoprotein carrier protein LolA [SAR324 cluster bacterium]|nr:outer membrane lipoprotein carrier protein LolA [SAR324 cluster bacterium]